MNVDNLLALILGYLFGLILAAIILFFKTK